MIRLPESQEYDAIIVGSGTCGATIARELSNRRKKILILEQGNHAPLKETFLGIASIADEVPVSDGLKAMRAITTGGSTGLYFAVVNFPPLDAFRSLGIDLTTELEEVRKELPLAPLPDELLGTQTIRLRDSALELGYPWKKNVMLIDQSKCLSGYSYDAKWKARNYVHEAVRQGATLINRATAQKVLVEKKQAIGVEYKVKKSMRRTETCRAYGTKIILAAGALATPKILRESGMQEVVNRGFYCEPGLALFGTVPGLKVNSKDNFMGSMSTDFEDDFALGDANFSRTFYRMLTLGTFRFTRFFSYSSTIGIGVKVKDGLGGALHENGSFYKEFTQKDSALLKKGEEEALKILKNAGAKDIFSSGITSAGHVGGMVTPHEHLDEKLQTKFKNLHVCDGSVLPENIRLTPTLTLVCLGKYLAKRLLPDL